MEENKQGYDPSEFEDDDYMTPQPDAGKSIRGYRIVIIILFRACFTIRTKSETVLRGIAITFAAFVLLGLLYVGYACPCRPASTKRRCWSI